METLNNCNCECHKNYSLPNLVNGLCKICKNNHEIKIIGLANLKFKDIKDDDETSITFSRLPNELRKINENT